MQFRDLPIKRKLVGVIFLTSLCVLTLTCLMLLTYEIYSYKQTTGHSLSTTADIISANSTAVLFFGDPKQAREILSSLRAEPEVTAAVLFDRNGKLYATYPTNLAAANVPSSPGPDGIKFLAQSVTIFKPVVQGQKRVGTLFLQADLQGMYSRLSVYTLVLALVLLGSGILAFLLSNFFERRLSKPLLDLANTAKTVSEQKDYSVRSVKTNDDEVGYLTEAFNSMLDQIQTSDSALRESEGRYRQLVGSLPAAVYTTDAQGRVTLYNEAAAVLWGRRPEIGKDLRCGSYRIFRPDGTNLPLDQCPMSVSLREGRPVRGVEIIIERPDGSRRNVLPSPDPIRDGSGKIVGAVNMLLDITESKLAEEAWRRLAAIVESSDDAIVGKDLYGNITSWNRGAERLFGYQAKEVIGRPITILLPLEQLYEETTILDHIRRGERMEHYETIRRRKDGRLIEVSLTVSPIKNANGKVIGASKIGRDITRQKQAERELERAHKEVVAASRAKDDFLAALSHELRTPLNPVLLLASEAAEDTNLPAGVRAQFTTIRNNVELEARLIDDLLDITRITRGKLPLNTGLVDVHTVLKQALVTVQSELDQKRLALTLELAAEQPTVAGDAVRLQQVFWNVLKNAVKFTPEAGEIAVATRALAEAGELIITVADSGIGMTRNELGRAFDAFTQGEHAQAGGSHRFGGLGLGLAISRMLVESHSGSIRASSEGRDQGSTLIITLPLMTKPATVEPLPDGESARPPAAFNVSANKMHILLVEDHEPTRTALAHLLTRRHYEVKTAGSLAEARGLIANGDFDLLISDIGLPDGTGYDLMEEIRQRCETIPGIALTGYGMEKDLANSEAAGFVAHLIKPVRIGSLEKALAAVTGKTTAKPRPPI